jgi:hypothetical protein
MAALPRQCSNKVKATELQAPWRLLFEPWLGQHPNQQRDQGQDENEEKAGKKIIPVFPDKPVPLSAPMLHERHNGVASFKNPTLPASVFLQNRAKDPTTSVTTPDWGSLHFDHLDLTRAQFIPTVR